MLKQHPETTLLEALDDLHGKHPIGILVVSEGQISHSDLASKLVLLLVLSKSRQQIRPICALTTGVRTSLPLPSSIHPGISTIQQRIGQRGPYGFASRGVPRAALFPVESGGRTAVCIESNESFRVRSNGDCLVCRFRLRLDQLLKKFVGQCVVPVTDSLFKG